jgi:hypothetical protein
MSTEQNLSGRERAIETHLDLAPDGALSRVNKVLVSGLGTLLSLLVILMVLDSHEPKK